MIGSTKDVLELLVFTSQKNKHGLILIIEENVWALRNLDGFQNGVVLSVTCKGSLIELNYGILKHL